MKIFFIVACTANGGIGKAGKLPWPHMKVDMEKFTSLTKGPGKAVVMGRKTWDSLPERHKPLKDRINIVVSSKMEDNGIGYYVDTSLPEAVFRALMLGVDELWLIGGASIYKAMFTFDLDIEKGYVTVFDHEDGDCDTFFPMSQMYSKFREVKSTGPFTQDKYSYKIKEFVKL